MKYSYYKTMYAPLNILITCCNHLNIQKEVLQENIQSYKTARGHNIIIEPKLPVIITPIFDMIIAHTIADGTVFHYKNRQIYFRYRQFDKVFRDLYFKKVESLFGKISFKKAEYFEKDKLACCPPVLSQLFFKYYNLNKTSFLSRSARIPERIFSRSNDYLLAVLIAFIIDEGKIDSSLIDIRLKNIKLSEDLYKICNILGYGSTFVKKGDYGFLYIKREGMKLLFNDYKKLLKELPEVYLGKWHKKIEDGFKIYNRPIYKTKGNANLILNCLKQGDLTVNQLADKINMTRQGIRFHIHNLERLGKIKKNGLIGRNNFVYTKEVVRC